MPLVARDDSLLTVIDLQPRFWAERLDAEDKRCAEEAARRAAWLAAAAHALGIPAVITEEDPEMNGPTDEAVLAALRADGRSGLHQDRVRVGRLPRDHGSGQVNRTSDRVAGRL